MKFHGSIFLILCVVAFCVAKTIPKNENSNTISCQYDASAGVEDYACFLSIENPEGRDDFEIIEGEHEPGLTNDDVTIVYGASQNTQIVPRILCQTFPNLRNLILYNSKVEFLTQDAFGSCQNIELINLSRNVIRIIPDRVFANNSNLQQIHLDQNQIQAITFRAFEDASQVFYLNLGYNQLSNFNPFLFDPLSSSLRILYLHSNGIETLPTLAFSRFKNLQRLDLGLNEFSQQMPDNVFSGLSNLIDLNLDGTNIRNLRHGWFDSLSSLQNLRLHVNRIRELPTGIFSSLTNLRELSLDYNELTFVNSDAFGDSLNSLQIFYLLSNQIQAFDENFIQNAPLLSSLYLINNECINENFFEVASNPEEVINSLQTCVTNFIGSIQCDYVETSLGYTCILHINNVVGNQFEIVEGNHLEGRTNDDVMIVQGLFQNTRNIPSVICNQFPNLEDIWLQESQVEIINDMSFAACENLWFLNLEQNNIQRIPANTFRTNSRLERFYVDSNMIEEIEISAFDGSALTEIEMGNNFLSQFDPRVFEPVSETLVELFLFNNRITELPYNAFRGFHNLDTLYLDENPLMRIARTSFRGLFSLTHLSMQRCNIQNVDPEWFEDLPMLNDIRLDFNNIRTLPPRLLNSQTELWVFSARNNQIRNLNSNVFGQSLNSLRSLYMSGNGLRSIDREIINQAQTLTTLHLGGNFCVDDDFFNVQGNREQVTDALSECTRMFDGFISCNYVLMVDIYGCHMTLHNVQPRDDFYYIPGAHVAGQTNMDVTVVDVIRQETTIIPSIICRQFPNLSDLYVDESFVEFINEESFEYCTNLEWLDLYGNFIRQIPDFTFANNPRLQTIYFIGNQIDRIEPNAFAFTNLLNIDFDFNQLDELNRRWMSAISETVVNLFFTHNQIRSIDANVFENFNALERLSLGSNRIDRIAGTAFASLTNLKYLYLNQNQLSSVDPQWFQTLTNLLFVSFYINRIEDIPAHTFTHQTNIREIDFGTNQLRAIHSDSFGASLNSISFFIADLNLIEFMDEEFLNQISRLDNLNLLENKCVNGNFRSVADNVESTRSNLQRCFDNFNRVVPFECVYSDEPGYKYICYLQVENDIIGNDRTEVIGGEHAEGRADLDVLVVEIYNQRLRTVPSVICRQFPNAEEIFISFSNVQTIRESSFANCGQLETLGMTFNPIHVILPGPFASNSRLTNLYLDANRISRIVPGAFSGTSLSRLDLSLNDLNELDQRWFAGASNEIRTLYLYGNLFRTWPAGFLNEFPNLEELDIGYNTGLMIPPNAFENVTNLREIFFDRIRLTQLHPEWFTNLQNLENLHLNDNSIRDIPNNVFEPLTSLFFLTLGNNPIRFIGVEAFGSNSLQNFDSLILYRTQLQAFDEELFNRATNLRRLYLLNNRCLDNNFNDVSVIRGNVTAEMQECFANFVGSMECEFIEIADQPYTCELRINNIAGRNHFTSIPGNHVGANTNSDVHLIEAVEQNTRNVPSILCETFPNVEFIYMTESEIEIIDETSFGGCSALYRLILADNNIHILPDNLFRSNPNLGSLSLYNNEISQIGINSFTGSRLIVINLARNELQTFNPAPFESVNGTLQAIDLRRTGINEISENSFANLQLIVGLNLNENFGITIHSQAFDSLSHLREIHLDNNGIRNLDANWFRFTNSLEVFTASSNNIRSLPVGLFENSVNLREIDIRRNSINTLSVYSFGFNTFNITTINAENNRINAFDILIFDQSRHLNSIRMRGNICFDGNVENIQENRDDAAGLLWTCFENYGIDEPDHVKA